MTKLSADQLVVANLTDDYIRDLETENQRYDITLAGDFVISVLPNGIKTWAFIYDFQGRHRRKTLGVFPDMNFSEAKIALERARNAMIRMDEPTEPPEEFARRPAVLGGGHYVSNSRKQRDYKKLFKILGMGGAVVLLGAVAMWWKNRPPPLAQTRPAAVAVDNTPLAMPANREAINTNGSNTPSAPISPLTAPTSTNDKEDIATVAQAANMSTTPPSSNTPANQPLSQAASAVDAPATIIDSSTRPTHERDSSDPSENVPTETITNPIVNAESEFTQSAPPSDSTIAVEATTQAPTPSSAPAEGATTYGGRVARSRITGNIVDLEPSAELGPEISYKNSGFTRVFYYTELRDFSDGNVVHRWELNGNIIDEVVLKVKKSWRWRTYSSKDLTPGLNGTWQVSTIDATGTVLDTETFTYEAR